MIILSLTAHQNIECLCDLLDNIKTCFIHYDILILMSITENLNYDILKKYDFCRIVTIRKIEPTIRGNIHLFQQHIINIKYLYDNNIKFDYFWFVASNELFIKIIPPDFLEKNSIKIIDKKEPLNKEDYDIYYKDLTSYKELKLNQFLIKVLSFDYFKNNSLSLTDKEENKYCELEYWYWLDKTLKDSYFMNYLYKNNFILEKTQHESMILNHEIVLEIFNEYNKSKIYENSIYKDYVMEETFVKTYLMNKYILTNSDKFSCSYIYNIHNILIEDFKDREKDIKDYHISTKPVKRSYDDPVRIYIRNKLKY